jgi:hypothetical protein
VLARCARSCGPWLVTFLVTLGAFDVAYQESRAIESVLGDNLLAYNELLAWWQLGDSPTGFTLTPSPYFIDLVYQLPLAVLCDDFERFAYWEAVGYALATAASLVALFRAVGFNRWTAALASALTMGGYYLVFPQELVLHLFVPNHTSEMIGSLLGASLLLRLVDVERSPRQRWRAVLFVLLVTVNALSSTFFTATFVLPALGLLAFIALRRPRRRNAAGLAALVVGAVATGTYFQALIAARWWPIRKDIYGLTLAQSAEHLRTVLLQHSHLVAPVFFVAGVVTAVLLIVRARRYRDALVIYIGAVMCCGLLPVLRGAFMWAYSFRFLQLPALASFAVVVGAAVLHAASITARRPGLARASGAATIAGTTVLFCFFHGPLSEFDARSMTAPLLECFAAPEHRPLLEDGLGTVLPARYLNASFRGPAHGRPKNVVIGIEQWHPPSLVASQNDVEWFRDGYRHGRASPNFLVTFGVPTASLAWYRRRIGEPDIVFRCPVPADWRRWQTPDRPDEDVETWVWKSDDAKRNLVDMVLHDNMRGLFFRPRDHEATIDARWGMDATDDSVLEGDAWTWQRRKGGGSRPAWTRPMFAPAARYRADVDLTVDGPAQPGMPGAIITAYVGAEKVATAPVAAFATSASFEYVSNNPGGPTSGDNTMFAIDAYSSDRISVRSIRLTRLEAAGADPLRVFR